MNQHDDKPQGDVAAEVDEATPAERIARRRLLKMVYVAPVIVGTLLISEDAAGQKTSCNPNANPCNPPIGCNPNECKPRQPKVPRKRR